MLFRTIFIDFIFLYSIFRAIFLSIRIQIARQAEDLILNISILIYLYGDRLLLFSIFVGNISLMDVSDEPAILGMLIDDNEHI